MGSNLTEQNIAHWNEVYGSRGWGKYPPEELVRFAARTFPEAELRRRLRALEVGCGPGPNLWYLAREGFTIAGIDGSANAIHWRASGFAPKDWRPRFKQPISGLETLLPFPGMTARSM